MTVSIGASELLYVANKPGLSESGGGHGAKGVDFQRWWAVFRMVELEQANKDDFLFLFEAVQDVAELDSEILPTHATIYQVKKKDSGTWSWSVMTGTSAPPKKKTAKSSNSSRKQATKSAAPDFSKVIDSALGKLHLSLEEFTNLRVEGYFISNAGCNFPLNSGQNAATSMPCDLTGLEPEYAQLLIDALSSIKPNSSALPDLNKLWLRKVAIHPDDPSAAAIKAALELLKSRSPSHAGQAASFVESLVMKISSLGRHTDTCSSFEELVKQRGFSRKSFINAISELETIPDRALLLKDLLVQLVNEGMDFMTRTKIQTEATRIARDDLTGQTTSRARDIEVFCDQWIDDNTCGNNFNSYLHTVLAVLKIRYSEHRDEELMAHFIMRFLAKCVDPN